MADDWVQQLKALNGRVRTLISDVTLGDKRQRRNTLQQVGRFRPLRRLGGAELENVLDGGLLVGVDGSINTFGGQFPYYVDLIRALAKPSRGEAVVVKSIHCPIPPEEEDDQETAIRNDNEVRQRMLAEFEVQAAIEAVDRLQPKLILMDGPLVRFDMRAKDSFVILCEKVTRNRIALLGCIENIESKVIGSVLGDLNPPGWRNRYDRELLWDPLAYGEVLEIRTAHGQVSRGIGLQHHPPRARGRQCPRHAREGRVDRQLALKGLTDPRRDSVLEATRVGMDVHVEPQLRQGGQVGRIKGLVAVHAELVRSHASVPVIPEADADLRDPLGGQRDRIHQIAAGITADIGQRTLGARQNHRFPQIRQQKSQHRGRKGHGVGAMHQHDPVAAHGFGADEPRQMQNVRGLVGGGILIESHHQLQFRQLPKLRHLLQDQFQRRPRRQRKRLPRRRHAQGAAGVDEKNLGGHRKAPLTDLPG